MSEENAIIAKEETKGGVLSREAYEKDLKIRQTSYEHLSQYSDFEQYKDYFHFDLRTYDEYLRDMQYFTAQPHQSEVEVEEIENTVIAKPSE